MKRNKKYIAYRCLILFTKGGRAPQGNSRDFFFGVLGRDGKSNEPHRQKHRSFDDGKW